MLESQVLNITLLYVEDEEAIRESLARFLQRRVRTLHLAKNGEEGLALYHEHNIDLVITDIQMPRMTGLEMASEIKALNDDTPIIITTAFNDEEFFMESIDIGIDKYIKKPINNKLLEQSLNKFSKQIISLKEVEAKNSLIKTIMDSSSSLMTITDGKIITYFNQASSKFFGVEDLTDFYTRNKIIDEFIVEKEGLFYSGMTMCEWIKIVIANPQKEFIVYMAAENQLKSDANAYLIRITEIPQDETFLITFVDVSVIEAEREKYLELSVTDALTGISNRAKFNESLESEVLRAHRYQTPLSLIMFDIDHFKEVNDTYGHPRGDVVLQVLTQIVALRIRKTDIFARYGGEEFMLILPETTLQGASDLAEKLRVDIAENVFEEIGTLTCSFGVTSYDESLSLATLLDKVDKSLYTAKENGRNKVIVS
jgi:two-component system, cell cycle response regulator